MTSDRCGEGGGCCWCWSDEGAVVGGGDVGLIAVLILCRRGGFALLQAGPAVRTFCWEEDCLK